MHSYDIRDWAFTLSDEPDAWMKAYDDAAWRQVLVPHDWAVEGAFAEALSSGTGYLPGGIGWYRAHVSLRALAAEAGSHVRLVFDGVYKNARVWVNGYHLGGRPSGYARFSFDVSEVLSYATDDDLVITVRVEHTDISDSRWYNGSGITRRVRFEVHGQVRLREHGTAFTTLSADAQMATVAIAQTLVNGTGEAQVVTVRHRLLSLSSGREHEAEATVELPAHSEGEASVTIEVPRPELWSDTSPQLYRLSSTLVWREEGAERSASYETNVGIRTFRFDARTGFSINGEARKLKGVCLHEDAGCLGTAVPAEVWLRRLLKLKDMGCNAIRMAHNPHAPELYRLCDALGFFVIDEAFDEWENAKNKWWQGHNVYPPRHQGYAKDFHEWHERDLVNMVESHRNHVSIVAWSAGNEIDYPNDPYVSGMFPEMTGNNDANKSARQRVYDPRKPDARRLPTIARSLVDIVRRADPTRPVTLGAAFPELSSRTGLTELFDLVGYNYKEHLYEEDHARFPDKPLVGSENSHRYVDWRHAADKDYIAGQFLWTGIDYLGEAHGWPIHGSGAGLLDVAGFEKHTFQLRRSWWSDTPVAHMVTRSWVEAAEKNFWSHPVSRSWDGAGDGLVEILCFANGDTPRLSCGGEEIALTRDEEHGWWQAVVPPRAAPLTLEARRGVEVIATDRLGPRGETVRLEAAVWHAPVDEVLRCDRAGVPREGVVQIECTLRDANGEVARDERVVTASVEGGDLLGLENGDLSDNTAYATPSRRSFGGRLIVFVRPHGATRVRLSAEGVPEISVDC